MARNEAAFLDDCLESARDCVDDMIVVDTGSYDGTAAIARRAGARVVCASWPGDLGHAHNLPLDHARGEWILSLDGDEVLDPAACRDLPGLVRNTRADGFRLHIRNYTYSAPSKMRRAGTASLLTRGALAYVPTCVVRLFRRGPRFRGQVHQSIAPAIRDRGGRIETSEAVIHHYGPLRTDREKTALYRVLARRQVVLTPRDARAWIDLGLTLTGPAERPGALEAFRCARGLGRRAEATFLLGRTLADMDRVGAAIPVLREAIRLNYADRAADFDRADAYELIGELLDGCGRARDAEAAYRRALTLRPASLAALNNLAGLLIDRGAFAAAERLLETLLAHYPGSTTAWATRGALHLRQGQLEAARRACETALDISPFNQPAAINLGVVRAAAAGRQRSANRPPDGELPPWQRRVGRFLQAASAHAKHREAVVSVIGDLHGGAGRVLVDAVAALRDRRHIVLCLEPCAASRDGLRSELRRLGADVATVTSTDDLSGAVRAFGPAVVLHHWSGATSRLDCRRVGGERWIAVGHAPLPMPPGYDAYVVLSDFHQQFQRHLPPSLLHRIPNGVDLRRFRGARRARRGPVTIAMLSRLDPGKFPRQLQAFLPPLERLDARLLIAGRGARRWEIEPELADADTSITFIGPLASRRVAPFLRQADIGLHLTEVQPEVCSIAILEMMAAGLPIVSQPRGCLTEMVTPGDNGWLASEPAEVASHLMRLIQSPAMRQRMGARSRARVDAFSMVRYRAALRNLVDAVMSRPISPRRSTRAAMSPETVSRRGWQPSLCYVLCADSEAAVEPLAAALAATGVAGIPGRYFEPARWKARRWDRDALTAVVEAAATPNGVFGTIVLAEDAARFEKWADVFARRKLAPGLHAIVVAENAVPEWTRAVIADCQSVVTVSARDVGADPDRIARRIARRLGF